jgi:hypothetical protein
MANYIGNIQRGNYIYNILITNVNIRENIQASTIKIRKTLFSSFKLDMEEKYLFKISAFSMDSYDNLKSVDKAVGHDIISNRML